MYEIPLEFCIDGISRVRFPPGMAELYEALKILGRSRSGKFRMWQSLALRGGMIGPYGASYRQGSDIRIVLHNFGLSSLVPYGNTLN